MQSLTTPAVELDQVFRILGRRKWLIFLVVVTAVAATDLYSKHFLPATYTATATLTVAGAQNTAGPAVSSTPSSLDGVVAAVTAVPQPTVATYLWQVTSPSVLTAAVTALAKSHVQISVGQLALALKVENLSDTDLVTITATAHRNDVATLANAAAQAFVAYEQAQSSLRYTHALAFLTAQETQVENQINSVALQLGVAQAQPTSAVDQQQLTALQNTLKGLQGAYSTLSEQVTTTQIAQAEAGSNTDVSIGAPATRPGGPIGVHQHVYLGLAFLVGLVGSAALSFLLEQLDHTVRTAADIRRAGGLPTLAVIPYVRHG